MPLKFLPAKTRRVALVAAIVLLLIVSFSFGVWSFLERQQATRENLALTQQLATTSDDLALLRLEDQFQINLGLEASISAIKSTYAQVVTAYEEYLDLTDSGVDTNDLTPQLGTILAYLSDVNYASATAELSVFNQALDDLRPKLAATTSTPEVQANLPQSNSPPPAGGYSRQVVNTEIGPYTVSLIAADLNSARVMIDTASDGDCHDNCPVLSLADYVSRSGAFAGVNGSYFCPASYPSCAGKTNTFDTLLMSKNKVYFNSDNNVYSTVPAVIFSGNLARFVGQSQEWGRDTGVAEAAYALKALGLPHALNLDSGGSTALYSGGYKVGPGRNIPNAVLLVNK